MEKSVKQQLLLLQRYLSPPRWFLGLQPEARALIPFRLPPGSLSNLIRYCTVQHCLSTFISSIRKWSTTDIHESSVFNFVGLVGIACRSWKMLLKSQFGGLCAHHFRKDILYEMSSLKKKKGRNGMLWIRLYIEDCHCWRSIIHFMSTGSLYIRSRYDTKFARHLNESHCNKTPKDFWNSIMGSYVVRWITLFLWNKLLKRRMIDSWNESHIIPTAVSGALRNSLSATTPNLCTIFWWCLRSWRYNSSFVL